MLRGTFGYPLAHGDARCPVVARMGSFGHLLEPESSKRSVVLDELDSCLKLQQFAPVCASEGFCGGKHCASDALSTRGRSYGNLPHVDAFVFDSRERASNETLALCGNDESLFCGLGLELFNAHPCKRGGRIYP